MMINIITGVIGIVGVAAFMGIMLWWVPAAPLIIIVVAVFGLMVADFVQTLRSSNGNRS